MREGAHVKSKNEAKMSEEEGRRWSVWFRPGKGGWIKVLATRYPACRGKNHYHLSWCEKEKRFAEGTEFKRLNKENADQLVEAMIEAREAGWLS